MIHMRIQKIKLLKIKQWTYINLDKGEILTYMYSHTNMFRFYGNYI